MTEQTTLGELSQTGGIVNAYNALLYVSDRQKNFVNYKLGDTQKCIG